MELQKIGVWPLEDTRVRVKFPDMKPRTYHAVNNISIANGLRVGPAVPASAMPRPGEPPSVVWASPYPTILESDRSSRRIEKSP